MFLNFFSPRSPRHIYHGFCYKKTRVITLLTGCYKEDNLGMTQHNQCWTGYIRDALSISRVNHLYPKKRQSTNEKKRHFQLIQSFIEKSDIYNINVTSKKIVVTIAWNNRKIKKQATKQDGHHVLFLTRETVFHMFTSLREHVRRAEIRLSVAFKSHHHTVLLVDQQTKKSWRI